MPNPDNVKALYEELKKSYEIGSEEDFIKYLSDDKNREALRKELEKDYDVGDIEAFTSYLGFGTGPEAYAQYMSQRSGGERQPGVAGAEGGRERGLFQPMQRPWRETSAMPEDVRERFSEQKPQTVQQQQPTQQEQPLGPEKFQKSVEMQMAAGSMQGFTQKTDAMLKGNKPFGGREDALAPARQARVEEEFAERFENSLEDVREKMRQDNSGVRKAWENANMRASSEWRFGRPVSNEAARLKHHDIDRMADEAWELMDDGVKTRAIRDVVQVLHETYPEMGYGEAWSNAEKIVRGESDKQMYEMAVQQNAPRNWREYLLEKVNGGTVGSVLEGWARSKAGTTGDLRAREEALEQYGKGHRLLDIGGSVLTIGIDPLTYIGGGLSGALVKGIGGKAVTRMAMETVLGKAATGMVAGGANLAVFEAGGEAAEQMKWGGKRSYNEATGQMEIGDYRWGDVASAAGRGVLLGMGTGVAGQLIGNVGDKLYKGVGSTVGKAAVRGGQTLTSIAAEGTVFALPEFMSGEGNWDTWLNSVEMMAGFKLSHGIKTIPQTYETLKKKPESRVGFETRLRTLLDGQPKMALTNQERAELKRGGYSDLTNLVDGYKRASIEQRNAIETRQPIILEPDANGEVPYNRFLELMEDKSISEAARAKMHYYVSGHKLPQTAVVGSTITEHSDADGNIEGYTVEALGKDSEVILSKRFKSKKEAEVELARINRQAELNGIAMVERSYDRYGDAVREGEALSAVSELTGMTREELSELMKRDPKTLDDVDKTIVERIKIEYTNRAEQHSSVGKKAEIQEEYLVDIDDALSKEPNRRSEQERQAIEEYLRRMLGEGGEFVFQNGKNYLPLQTEKTQGDNSYGSDKENDIASEDSRSTSGQRPDGSGIREGRAERAQRSSDGIDIEPLQEGMASAQGGDYGGSERDIQQAYGHQIIESAKKNGVYVDPSTYKGFGVLLRKPSGESDVYINEQEGRVVKIKDPFAKMPMKGHATGDVLYEHIVHNILFPDTPYRLLGISEQNGEMRLVLEQEFFGNDYKPATQEQIDKYMTEVLGLEKEGKYWYGNDILSITDVVGGSDNVIVGVDGRLHFIDPIIKFKVPGKDVVRILDGAAGKSWEDAAYDHGYNADKDSRIKIAMDYRMEPSDEHRAAVEGVEQRIRDDAEEEAVVRRQELEKKTHGVDGNVHPATLKEVDAEGNPKEVYIVDGDFMMDAEGNISGDETIVVYDPLEGKNRFVSPMEIESLGAVTTAEQELQAIETEKEARIERETKESQGQIVPGMRFPMADGVQGTIISIEGDEIVYQRDDGEQGTMPLEETQALVDTALMEEYRKRYGTGRQGGQPSAADQMVEGVPERYEPKMRVRMTGDDGQEHEAVVVGAVRLDKGRYVPDENGQLIEYYVDVDPEDVRHDYKGDLDLKVAGYMPVAGEESAMPLQGKEEENTGQQASTVAGEEAERPEVALYEQVKGEYGEDAREKVENTVKIKAKRVEDTKKALDKAREELKKTEFGSQAEATAREKRDKAQKAYDAAVGDHELWKAVKHEKDQEVLAEQAAKDAAMEAEKARRRAELEAAKERDRQAYEAEVARRKAEREKELEILNQIREEQSEADIDFPIENDEEAMREMNDLEPRTLEEVAAHMLADTTGKYKIDPELIREHTGYSTADLRKFPFVFAKGGMSPEAFGEKIEQIARESNVPFNDGDTNLGLDALLNVMGEVGSLSDLKNYIKENRRINAERLHNLNIQREAAARAEDRWVAQHGGMTREEYTSYINWMEDAVEQGKTALTDEEYNQLFNTDYDRTAETNDERGDERGAEKGSADESEAGQAGVAADDTRGDGEAVAGQRAGGAVGEENTLGGARNSRELEDWFGPIYTQFEGKANEAEAHLRETTEGVAKGALVYPGVAPIDLVWGDMSAGYMKILIKHPEVVGKLQDILSATTITSQSDNRIVFESDTHKMVVSRMKGQQPTDNWLLTAYEKKEKPVSASSSDIETEPEGKRNGTATPQNGALSSGKDTNNSETSQINNVTASIAAAEAEVNTEPTEGQKKAGNYKMGHVKVDGYDITIENPKGSMRRGTDPSGKAWEQEMHNTYGYIKGTVGFDKDHIDIFLSDDPTQGNVYVVDQVNSDGTFDEHKVMYGFPDAESARQAYLSNYEEGWQGLGAITPVSKEEFKKWIESSKRKMKPFSEYRSVETLGDVQLDRGVAGTYGGPVTVSAMASQGKEEEKDGNQQKTADDVEEYNQHYREAEAEIAEIERQLDKQPSAKNDALIQKIAEEMYGAVEDILDAGGTVDDVRMVARHDAAEKWMEENLWGSGPDMHKVGERLGRPSKAEKAARKLLDGVMKRIFGKDYSTTIKDGQQVIDEANGEGITLNKAQKRTLETARLNSRGEGHKGTVVSSVDGAKILKNLDTLAENLEKSSNRSKTFIGDVAKSIGAKQFGSKSQYATFETKNGQTVTIRLGNHNATVSNFDNNGEDNGISIVISRRANKGITNDGTAHLVEFFYPDKAISNADGEPLAEIVRSIEQSLYSGEYKDTTGLAEREEVNAEQIRYHGAVPVFYSNAMRAVEVTEEMKRSVLEGQPMFHKVFHGSGADFEAFDSKKIGSGQGAQSYGWGHYTSEVEGIGRTYAQQIGDSSRPAMYKGMNLSQLGQMSAEKLKELGADDEAKATTLYGIVSSLNYGFGDPVRMIRAKRESLQGSIKSDSYIIRRKKEDLEEEKDEAKRKRIEDSIAYYQSKIDEANRLIEYVDSLDPKDFDGWKRSDGHILYTVEIPDDIENVRKSDAKWEKWLAYFAKNKLTMYDSSLGLGDAGEVLKACGLPSDSDLYIQAKTLKKHLKKHGLTEDDIKELPSALRDPMLVYEWGTKAKSLIVVTELSASDGRKITAAIKLERNGKRAEVNEITSIHGKEERRMLSEFVDEKNKKVHGGLEHTIKYIKDKEKVLDWLGLVPPQGTASLTEQELSVAKILNNFENPQIDEKKYGEYLEWDKKITQKQVSTITEGLKQLGIKSEEVESTWEGKPTTFVRFENENAMPEFFYGMNGEIAYHYVYRLLGSEKAASEFLHSIGFTGIKYPAQYRSGGREDNAKNYVIFDDGDLKIVDKVKFFRTKNGTAYGFTVDGKIYIDPRIATSETRVHEYAHLWVQALRSANPEAWEKLKAEMRQEKEVMDYVKRLYPELKSEDELMEEVFTHYAGRRGAERLVEDMRESMAKEPDLVEKARIATVFHKLREMLDKFWSMARDLFAGNNSRLAEMKGEDFADMMLSDLLHEVDPRARARAEQKKRDKEYMEAVEKSDMETAQRMVNEAAKEAGYIQNDDYKMSHRAPAASVDKKDFTNLDALREIAEETGDVNLFAVAQNVSSQPDDYFSANGPRWYNYDNAEGMESLRNLKVAMNEIKRQVAEYGEVKDMPKVKVYRAVPKDIKAGQLESEGQWVSPSREYAKGHGQHVLGYGNYRIIEQEVRADELWWDGNDINEWGFDDGTTNAYKNTKNNRKLLDPVTYDDAGNVIPLSQRFNKRNADIRFQKVGEEVSPAAKERRLLNDKEKNNARTKLENTKPIVAGVGVIRSTDTMSARNAAEQWAGIHLKEPLEYGTEAGVVVFDKTSVKDSLAHGYSQAKLDAIPTIPEGFKNATYLGSLEEVGGSERNKTIEHYFAYPIDYNGELCYVFCRAKEDVNKNRLYVHEVFIADKIKSNALQTAAGKESEPRRGIALYRNILSDILGAKVQKNSETAKNNLQEAGNEGSKAPKGREAESRYVFNPYAPHKTYEESLAASRAAGYTKRQHDAMVERRKKNYAERGQRAKEMAEKLNLGGIVEIRENADGLEERFQGKKGWYNPRTGKITVVLDKHGSMDDILQTILHEGVGHHGLREMFGKHFDDFIDNVYNGATLDVRRRIIDLAKHHGWDYRTGTEEYLAQMAETMDFEKPENRSWWQKVKDFFFDMLHKLGIKGAFAEGSNAISDNELSYILWRSYQNLVNPGRYRSFVDMANDTVMQDKLKVGNFEERQQREAGGEWQEMPMAAEPRTLDEFERGVKETAINEEYDVKEEGESDAHHKRYWQTVHYLEGGNVSFDTAVEMDMQVMDEYNALADKSSERAEELVGMMDALNPWIDEMEEWESYNGSAAEAREGDGIMFRDGDFSERDRVIAADYYERMLSKGSYQFREAMQDSMLGLRKAYEAILGSKNFRIEDVAGNENAYMAENAISSANNAQQDNYFNRYMKPLLRSISDLVGRDERKRQDLLDYMMAKHGLERNRVFAERDAMEAAKKGADYADELQKNRGRDYAGLTALTGEADVVNAEGMAQKMVDDYENNHDTTALWDAVNTATKVTLAKMYMGGLMSRENYEQVRDMFSYYIPLRGFDETTSDEVYGYLTSKNGLLGGSILKHAEGRSSKADDPIANIALMADAAIRQSNRNMMKQKFLTFVQNHPSDLVSVNKLWLQYDAASDEWVPVFADIESSDTPDEVERKVEAFEQHMEQLAANEPDKYKSGSDAVNIPYRVMKSDMREHQVLVKRGGETFVLTINGNPRAAQALNGLTNPDVETGGVLKNFMKGLEKANHFMSAAYTTRTPDFIVSNFFRDTLYSNCMTWVKESPSYALRFHKNFGKFNPAVMMKLFEKWEYGELDDSKPVEFMFKQFMLHGGETGYTNVKDIEAKKKEVAKALRREGDGMVDLLNILGEQLDILNRSVENVARFAAFITSQEMGRSIERSIYDAKEVSVNFNKKGSGGKMVDATGENWQGKIGSYLSGGGRLLYVFWNAGVQGMTNFGRSFKRHPGKALTAAATMFALGYVIPLLAEAMWSGDDDDKDAYYNLPEYVRRSNMCIRAGKQWLTVPLTIEFRAVYGLGELATGVITGKEHYSDSELTRQMVSQVSQILPLDFMEGGGGWHAFVPSAAKPIVEAYSNKGWTGLPIYRESPYDKEWRPNWTKAYKGADKYIVGASKWLSDVTGGDEYIGGAVDINPARLEYILNGYLGGFFKVPNQLAKMAETAFGDREFEWRNMMIANRLLKNGDERTENRKLQNEYFKYKEEYEKTKDRVKNYTRAKEEGVLKYAEKLDFLNNSPEYARYEIFDKYRKTIDNLYKAKKEASGDEGKALEAEYYDIIREMVTAMHSYEDSLREKNK